MMSAGVGQRMLTLASDADSIVVSAVGLLNNDAHVFIAAFLVTLLTTPIVRRIAIASGVIDRPDSARKVHRVPVAYLGGVAVFLGLLAAIMTSYLIAGTDSVSYQSVPIAVVIGMIAITFTGLADDVWGWDPRLKIAGQLVAAAGLAINDIGVRVAEGLFRPFMGPPDALLFSLGSMDILNGHLFYWVGTALIAIFVLGGCNAANLIDGLDGLLSGVVAVTAIGLLAICLLVAPSDDADFARAARLANDVQVQVDAYENERGRPPNNLNMLVRDGYLAEIPELPAAWPDLSYDQMTGTVQTPRRAFEVAERATDDLRLAMDEFAARNGEYPQQIGLLVTGGFLDDIPRLPRGWRWVYTPGTDRLELKGPLTGARIVLCMALLGAVLGFLPHNFNPATIFLGDCGSLLLGYMCVVVILMLGNQGQSHLVFAGLIVFAVPIMDTILAIIRRKLAGKPFSSADDQHIHHQLKRSLGGVKPAVLALYGISALFAIVGVSLVALVLSELRVLFVYAIALVLFSFIGVIAVKEARRQQLARQMADQVAAETTGAPVTADSASTAPAAASETPARTEAEPPTSPTSSS